MVFFWFNSATKRISKIGESIKTIELPQIENQAPIAETQKDETADWKTYKNDEGKFSLKYPSIWKFTTSSSNSGAMKTIIFTGNEGIVQVDYGQGFGGMCQQGYEKIQIGDEQFDACHYVGNGSMGEGFEQWDVSAKEFSNNLGIGMFVTANKPHLSNRVTILKIISTFKFTE